MKAEEIAQYSQLQVAFSCQFFDSPTRLWSIYVHSDSNVHNINPCAHFDKGDGICRWDILKLKDFVQL